MGEGALDGIFGGSDDARAGKPPVGLQPFAAAIAAELAAHHPEVAAETASFLREQTEVLKIQKRSLEAEYEYFEVEWAPRLLGIRLRTAFQLMSALVATLIALGICVMVYDATRAHAVIVDAFDAPPNLAGQGLTGKVVAEGVLDELTRLQAATHTTVQTRDLSNAWSGDITIQLPDTGISIGELNRLLKQRFGHDLHIGGDLVQTDQGGLALTVRGTGVLPRVFTGRAGDIARLTTAAAEYIYGQSQPGPFITYLSNAGRNAEAAAFAAAVYPAAKSADLPYILNAWGIALENTGATPQQALPLYRAARALKPDYWSPYGNIINDLWLLGDEEGAWQEADSMRRAAGGRPGRAPDLDYADADQLSWNLQALRKATLADVAAHGGVGTYASTDGPTIALADALLHDRSDAEFRLQTLAADATDPTVAANSHFVRGLLAMQVGDAATAVSEMEAYGRAAQNPVVASNNPGFGCWIAPAEEAAGHPDAADAALRAGGHFVDCYRFRGDILDHRGNWQAAQGAYAAAVALAPDLPAAYYSWGVALARHHDFADAIAKLSAAHKRAPNWADPLKAWADVLAQQGKWRQARARYDSALRDAPAWDTLQAARAIAASRS